MGELQNDKEELLTTYFHKIIPDRVVHFMHVPFPPVTQKNTISSVTISMSKNNYYCLLHIILNRSSLD